jgi:hypothetical protein
MVIIPSYASTIKLTIEPIISVIDQGNVGIITLRASDLPVNAPPSLYAFGARITYDESVLDLEVVSFSNWLGNPSQIDTVLDLSTPGEILIGSGSRLLGDALDALQTVDNFVLAAMSFRGVSIGRSALDFVEANVVLIDGNTTFLLPPNEVETMGSHVFVTNVTQPNVYLLFMSGLGLILVKRWKRSRNIRN